MRSKSVQTRLGPKSCQELCISWADLPPPPKNPFGEPLEANCRCGMVWKNWNPYPKPSSASNNILEVHKISKNMPSSWHHWHHLPGDSADKCQNQLQGAFPQTACFFLLLNVPFGETTGGEQLTSTSQMFLHYNHHSCAWSRGKQKHPLQSCLEPQAWRINVFTTKMFEKQWISYGVPTISSDVVRWTCRSWSQAIWLSDT